LRRGAHQQESTSATSSVQKTTRKRRSSFSDHCRRVAPFLSIVAGGEGVEPASEEALRGVEEARPHCLTRDVTGQIPADEWAGVTESGRWRRWRDRSAWARGARFCRRWRNAIGRRGGGRRGAFSTSCAPRWAGIASMQCARLDDTARRRWPGSRNGLLSQAQVRCNDQRRGDGALGGVGSGMR
jgi:hypothetical protein